MEETRRVGERIENEGRVGEGRKNVAEVVKEGGKV